MPMPTESSTAVSLISPNFPGRYHFTFPQPDVPAVVRSSAISQFWQQRTVLLDQRTSALAWAQQIAPAAAIPEAFAKLSYTRVTIEPQMITTSPSYSCGTHLFSLIELERLRCLNPVRILQTMKLYMFLVGTPQGWGWARVARGFACHLNSNYWSADLR